MIKIISLLLSALVGFAGISQTLCTDIADSFTELVFGLPCTDNAVSEEYIYNLSDDNVTVLSKDNGYIKNHIVLVLDPEVGITEKFSLFFKNNIKAVAWSTPVDLYVAKCNSSTLSDMVKECEKLLDDDRVLLAMPLLTTRNYATYTPDDPFDFEYDTAEQNWDETDPDGSNWWLEAVNARQAWDYEDRFNDVTLGIVDTGYQTDHPDLAGKITFPNSKQARRNIAAYHGTHVAGIMSANANNNEGISGVCPKAKLTCTDWEPDGNQMWITTIAIVFGLADTVKAGAKAVNFSVGMSSSISEDYNKLNSLSYKFSAAISSYAMASLLSKGYDFVVCHSAGNGNSAQQAVDARQGGYFSAINEDTLFTGRYNVSLEEITGRIITVGSAVNLGNGEFMQSDYSNSGPEVSITAPGSAVYSCTVDSSYCYLSGTSMAAPIVAAVAGLIFSINPDFTGKDVKNIICSCTDKVAVKSTGADYIGEYCLRDIPMVNASLCVEEAIRRTYDNVGTVSGTIETPDKENSVAEFGGKEYTILSDGTFRFVTDAGSGTLTIKTGDGTVVAATEITVEAGKTVTADFTPEEPEPETDPVTEPVTTETVL